MLSGSVEHTSSLAVEVCINVAKSFTAAAAFTHCRQRILEMSAFATNLCYTLYFKVRGWCKEIDPVGLVTLVTLN